VFQPYATVAANLLFFDKVKSANSESDDYATKEVWYYQHNMQTGVKAYSKTRPIKIEEFDPIKKWWKNREESEISWKVPIETIIEKGFDLDFKNPTKQEEAHEYNSAELMQMLEKSFSKSNSLLNQLKAAVNE